MGYMCNLVAMDYIMLMPIERQTNSTIKTNGNRHYCISDKLNEYSTETNTTS